MPEHGKFTYRDGIAVAQIAAFSAPLVFAFYFRYIHQIGWFCIGVFALLRIVSGSCKLATIKDDSHGLWAAIFVCESLGMILIIFLLLEMLERINKVSTTVSNWLFWIPSIITWLDIAISIAGWVTVMHVAHPLAPTPYSQASMALLAVIYLYLVAVFVVFWRRCTEYADDERWALKGVTICVPLLAVRLVYSLIFVISGNMKFNAIKGDSTTYLVMTMLPEVAIILVCTYMIAARIPPLQQDGKRVETLRQRQHSKEINDSTQILDGHADKDEVWQREFRGLRWLLICIAVFSANLLYGLDNTIVADIHADVAGFQRVLPAELARGRLHSGIGGFYSPPEENALCGATPSMNAIIIGRVWAGVGGAGMHLGNLNLITILTTPPPRDRPCIWHWFGLIYGTGCIMGPIIGGNFSDSSAIGRWAFYLNLIIFAVISPVYVFLLPSLPRAAGQGRSFVKRLVELD
ncbi:uncharacterized protein N7459_001640 [Penicillium hispanicum]|uniref:uncharacterized protein n=1 Tax=Penicillium hispanicum TaxID=1080232 RepID=UPI00253FB239|nr:uncharacterized protein N7459_001640 [Penicillium hispanicum]KAJ5595432.1 hypothetical protein N7459_001640 [Penicillium hispanicum]